jgi:uncharacterized membrane protein
MKLVQRILSNLSFFIIVMLLFLLFFQNKVSLPPVVQVIGRMHPLLLHLPIGFLIIAFIFWLGRKNVNAESFSQIFILLLQVTAFTAALAALMGFFLSREGGYEETLLGKHRILGVGTAVLSYVMILIYQWKPEHKILFNSVLILSLAVLVLGSHFGSVLTHGEGFVWQPVRGEQQTEDEKITDSSTLFAAAVRPILKSKCFSCHNEKKAKGGLVMTTEEKILKGGKNGPIWKSGDALNSHIIQNVNLPEDDKKHMPPKGKPQLTEEEIKFLFAWIQDGANMTKSLKEYGETDTIKILAAKFIHHPEEEKEKTYPFSAASASAIQKLNGPFCSVFPVSQKSPALQADFFVREKFDRKNLEELAAVKKQLVSLSLANMPVTDEDMKIISQFINLEKLNLNNSSITNKGLEEISRLKQLRSLSVAGTQVDKNAAQTFSKLDSLKEVFTWNSKISVADATVLQKRFSRIAFNTGYMPDEKEILTLTPPLVKNEEFILSGNEKIELKHPIPGAEIRFTADGTIPDSTSSNVYRAPFTASGFLIIKARAVKPGWYSSPISEYSFFLKGIKPSGGELINKPDERHRAEGVFSLYNLKTGTAENTNDAEWLGYREKPFAALIYFDTVKTINSISISYCKNVPAYILPPAEVEIWCGQENSKMNLLKKISLPQTTKEEGGAVKTEGIKIDIPGSAYKCYKIVAKNVPKLPKWHPGKGEKSWVFIDEIFFN